MKDLSNVKVLLIEDNPLLMKTSSRLLKRNQITVLEAFDAESAMMLFNSNPDIDLILSDIDLGTEIDGTDLARVMLAKRDVPLIFLSAHKDIETVSKTESITSYGYIEKNTGEQILIASIKMAFKLHDTILLRKQSESLYRNMFIFYPNPLWIFDLETLNFLMVNRATEELYGYSKEEFLRMKITDIRPTEDVPILLEAIHARNFGLNDMGIWKHKKKSGEIFSVRILSHLISWKGYKAELILASVVNKEPDDAT